MTAAHELYAAYERALRGYFNAIIGEVSDYRVQSPFFETIADGFALGYYAEAMLGRSGRIVPTLKANPSFRIQV